MHQVSIGLVQCYLRAHALIGELMGGGWVDHHDHPRGAIVPDLTPYLDSDAETDEEDEGEEGEEEEEEEEERPLRPCQCNYGDHHCTRQLRSRMPLSAHVLCHDCVPCNDQECLPNHPTGAHCVQSEACLRQQGQAGERRDRRRDSEDDEDDNDGQAREGSPPRRTQWARRGRGFGRGMNGGVPPHAWRRGYRASGDRRRIIA